MENCQGRETQLSPLNEPGAHTPSEVKKLISQPLFSFSTNVDQGTILQTLANYLQSDFSKIGKERSTPTIKTTFNVNSAVNPTVEYYLGYNLGFSYFIPHKIHIFRRFNIILYQFGS